MVEMRRRHGASPKKRPPEPDPGCPECGARGTLGAVNEYEEDGAELHDVGCTECEYIVEEGRLATPPHELREKE